MTQSISSILRQTDAIPDENGKIQFLRTNYSKQLSDILLGALDDRIEWQLPPGKVPYTPLRGDRMEGRLYHEASKLYIFVKGGGSAVTQMRREQLFIQVLESVHPEDAALLEYVKDKKLPWPSITPDLFRKAFPNIPLVSTSRDRVGADPLSAVVATEKPKKRAARKGKKAASDVEVQA